MLAFISIVHLSLLETDSSVVFSIQFNRLARSVECLWTSEIVKIRQLEALESVAFLEYISQIHASEAKKTAWR